MGKASRKKKERRENPQVPHLEVHASLASASATSGPKLGTDEKGGEG